MDKHFRFSKLPIKKYVKHTGIGILVLLVIFVIFTVYLNSQDLNQLNIKNSDRRKIADKYDDKNMNKFKNQHFIYRQNEKFKRKRWNFIKKPNMLNTKHIKNNIKDYKKKIKDTKKNNF